MTRRPQYGFRWTAAALVAAAAILLLGCEEDVVAVSGAEVPFTLYGVLNPHADTQSVRVYPVEDSLYAGAAGPLDARFTSTNLQTGELRVWRDSVLREADGLYAHVFWSPFHAAYKDTYRLEVTRSDGAATRVEVAVPREVRLVPQKPVWWEDAWEGEGRWAPLTVPVIIEGAPRLRHIEAEYHVQTDFEDGPLGIGTQRLVIDYQRNARQIGGEWHVGVTLPSDRGVMWNVFEEEDRLNPEYGIRLLGLTLRMHVVCSAWAVPAEVYSTDLLVQPGLLENVENGYGFVGAGYELESDWMPPDSVLKAARFRLE